VSVVKPASADKRIVVAASPEVEAVERELAELATASGPIVLGPWDGGVTEELLYWLPFLRWAVERYGLERQRLIAVGGVRSWYADLCGDYANEPPSGAATLTPTLARRVYQRYREGRGAPQELLDRLRFERLNSPGDGSAVAVAFEPTSSFPDTADNRELADALVERLRSQAEVVTLEPDLEARTAAIGRARAFVGSYGDAAHIALALGVPAVALYSELGAVPWQDVEMAARAAWRLGTTFSVYAAEHVELVAALAASALSAG
jgi:hypothetical protein